MHHRDRGSVSARLPVPQEIHIGAVIGSGGCNAKQIQTKYGVRCLIDAKKREAVVTGPRGAVDGAIDGLQDLFRRLRLERLQNLDEQRHRRSAARIYRIAAMTNSTHGSWMFQRFPNTEQLGEEFENCLIHLESFESDSDSDQDTESSKQLTGKWIERFGAVFQGRMIQDVQDLVASSDRPREVKVKAALGLTTYTLPDANTARRLFTWEQLQNLKLHQDFRRRWENTCNMRSESVAALMRVLDAHIPGNATYETALTIYVGSDDGMHKDVSLKYVLTNNQWIPETQRAPIREPHCLYNVGLDDETAFRVRVYSREYLPRHQSNRYDLWDAFSLTPHPTMDALRTEITLRKNLPEGLFIRSTWLREKTKADHDGLRYSISYQNAARTDAIVQCQTIPSPPNTISPVEQLRDLVDGMVSALNFSVDGLDSTHQVPSG